MNKPYKLYAYPKLKNPVLLAAWPGIGNVAMIVATYLEKSLGFKRLGEIRSPYFFDPLGIIVRNNVVEAPNFPQNRFYYWKNNGEASDIILFIGEQQPSTKSYELANCILDVGARFGSQRIYTFAAALTRIHHTEQPKAWGVATDTEVSEELKKINQTQKGNLQIAGLNGLILGVAKERGLEGICLLGEVPTYATKIQNPIAALAILRMLTMILGIKIDMAELVQLASDTREGMKRAAAEAMGEYIDYFTEPIWEQDEDDEDEEEEED